MKVWNFAVIGCGAISSFHIDAIRNLDNARLVNVSDRKEEKARAIGERENCGWTTRPEDILSDPEVDVVCLTTPSGSHGSMGLEILRAGKHLLVEKPVAMTAAEAECMIRTAEEKGVTLSVMSQRRFEPQNRLIHRVIREKGIGELLLAEVSCPYYRTQEYYDSSTWRGTRCQDGGVLMNQAIHSIDLLLWFCGPARTVFGKTATQTHRMEAEDIGAALLQFESGAFGTITASTSIRPGLEPELNLYGEKGTIKLRGTAVVHWTVDGYARPEQGESTGGGVSDPTSISGLYHQLQMEDLIEALSAGREPAVTGWDGLRAVRLIEAIYRSSQEGKQLTLPVGR